MAEINSSDDEDALDLALAERQLSYTLLQETSRSTVAPTRILGQSIQGEEVIDD